MENRYLRSRAKHQNNPTEDVVWTFMLTSFQCSLSTLPHMCFVFLLVDISSWELVRLRPLPTIVSVIVAMLLLIVPHRSIITWWVAWIVGVAPLEIVHRASHELLKGRTKRTTITTISWAIATTVVIRALRLLFTITVPSRRPIVVLPVRCSIAVLFVLAAIFATPTTISFIIPPSITTPISSISTWIAVTSIVTIIGCRGRLLTATTDCRAYWSRVIWARCYGVISWRCAGSFITICWFTIKWSTKQIESIE